MHNLDSLVNSINLISSFLADQQIEIRADAQLISTEHPECIVLAASSVLYGAETIFRQLQTGELSTKTLVLCGGIGHSTTKIWEAVRNHPIYSNLASLVDGLPEACVLHEILKAYFDMAAITRSGCRVLIESKSTNCGSNALETRKLLEQAAIPLPAVMWIVQDPTMQRRTRASFQRVFEDVPNPPNFLSYPTFVPMVASLTSDDSVQLTTGIRWAISEIPSGQLWQLDRFFELIIGEIPRIRDDEDGYGPRGKHFIAHVDIPSNVESAWRLLFDHFQKIGLDQGLRSLAPTRAK